MPANVYWLRLVAGREDCSASRRGRFFLHKNVSSRKILVPSEVLILTIIRRKELECEFCLRVRMCHDAENDRLR